MKVIVLEFKKQVMDLTPYNWILWTTCICSGCYAYVNVPNFVMYIGGISSFFGKTFELLWGMMVAFVMGIVAVLAKKVADQWWADKGRPIFQRFINKKKKDKNNI